jgi:hypothetical protein
MVAASYASPPAAVKTSGIMPPTGIARVDRTGPDTSGSNHERTRSAVVPEGGGGVAGHGGVQ